MHVATYMHVRTYTAIEATYVYVHKVACGIKSSFYIYILFATQIVIFIFVDFPACGTRYPKLTWTLQSILLSITFTVIYGIILRNILWTAVLAPFN